MDRLLLSKICEQQANGIPLVLVTIIATRGSTPRKAGSGMLILPDGTTFGTIGGGCGEAAIKRRALQALDENNSCLYILNMFDGAEEENGMICGGIMEVFIQVIG